MFPFTRVPLWVPMFDPLPVLRLASNHSFQPSFFSNRIRFPWDSGGFLERRIPRKNGNGRYPRAAGTMLQELKKADTRNYLCLGSSLTNLHLAEAVLIVAPRKLWARPEIHVELWNPRRRFPRRFESLRQMSHNHNPVVKWLTQNHVKN